MKLWGDLTDRERLIIQRLLCLTDQYHMMGDHCWIILQAIFLIMEIPYGEE